MPQDHAGETFWDHVTEFIKRMKKVLFTFVVAVFVILILPSNSDFFATTSNYSPLIKLLLDYMRDTTLPSDVKLFATAASDPISLYVLASVLCALVITLPVFAYEAYKFLAPALYSNEKKAIFPFVSIVTLLFITGTIFGFFFLAPSFIRGLFPFFYMVGAEPWMSIMDFYGMLFFTVIVGGVLFTIPAFFVLLVKFHAINTKMFAKKRKYIYAGLVITALLVSPGATPQGDLYLFLALAFMFEISMLIGKRFDPKTGSINNPSIMRLFSPKPTCKYCNTETPPNSRYCPGCKRYLG